MLVTIELTAHNHSRIEDYVVAFGLGYHLYYYQPDRAVCLVECSELQSSWLALLE